MRNFLFIPLFLLITCFTLEAADFYLMYDPNCMNRLTYRSQVGSELVKYSMQLNDNEQIMLEVTDESQARVQSFLPRQAFRCGNSFISQNLTSILQNNLNNVYLVKPVNNNGYHIIAVRSYDYYLQEGNYMVYNGQQFRFNFSPSLAAVGQDLSSNDPRGQVQFEGKIKYNCADALLFKQRSGLSSNASIDIVFVPQLGVVEQKSPQFNNTIQLVQVNDMTTDTYLQQFCTANNNNSTAGLNNYNNGAFNTNTNTNNPNTILNSRGEDQQNATFHIVAKGETLYGIARNYNINIEELRSWNGIAPKSSFLRTGTKLRVSQYTDEYSSRSVSTYNEAPINNRPIFNSTNGILPAWKTTSGLHIVKPGESLTSIAALYGYTAERFSEFNNLAPNSQLREGQSLKTKDCDPINSVENPGALNNYNNNPINSPSIQPTQPQFNTTTPSSVNPAGNSTYDSYYFNRGSQQENYNFSQPSTNNNNQNSQSEDFEPYDIFSNSNNNNANQNRGNNNLNVSPSQYNNFNPNPSNSFGTPVPNTAAPTINGANNSREPFQDLNSPVPGVNPNSPNPNTNLDRFNISPPQNNRQNNFQLGGTTDYYNNAPGNAKRISHIVKQGETMETISKKYNIPLNKLLQLNRMQKGESVLPDQRIYLN